MWLSSVVVTNLSPFVTFIRTPVPDQKYHDRSRSLGHNLLFCGLKLILKVNYDPNIFHLYNIDGLQPCLNLHTAAEILRQSYLYIYSNSLLSCLLCSAAYDLINKNSYLSIASRFGELNCFLVQKCFEFITLISPWLCPFLNLLYSPGTLILEDICSLIPGSCSSMNLIAPISLTMPSATRAPFSRNSILSIWVYCLFSFTTPFWTYLFGQGFGHLPYLQQVGIC